MGDFVQCRRTAEIVRLDKLFVHTFKQERRLFAWVSALERKEEKDMVLDLPLMRFTGARFVVGLPSIDLPKLYVVPLAGNAGRQGNGEVDLLLVEWSIQYL
jgi:hypothetical protein